MDKIMVRHGDILCENVDKLPKGAKVKKGNVIVSSSNDHIIEGEGKIYSQENDIFVKVTGKANLNHNEHKKINLPIGVYKVIRQIEFNGYENLAVED